jgi:hypothetical protein
MPADIPECIVSESKGSSDEDIGRPGPWREGRYQQPGKSVDDSVDDASQRSEGNTDPVSTPVTRKDYENK